MRAGDLKHLGFVSRPNPQHKRWSDMRLYLQMQVSPCVVVAHALICVLASAAQTQALAAH
jgi:hypothetical protein